MDISSNAPFVNRDMLGQFVQRRVRLAGHVESFDGTSIRVKAADDGIVNVTLRQPSSFDDKYILVDGMVESPDTIAADSHTNAGNNFGALQMSLLLPHVRCLPRKRKLALLNLCMCMCGVETEAC